MLLITTKLLPKTVHGKKRPFSAEMFHKLIKIPKKKKNETKIFIKKERKNKK